MTLLDRLGGHEALDLVVDKYYDIVNTDHSLRAHLQNVDIAQQRVVLKQSLLAVALSSSRLLATTTQLTSPTVR